MQEKDIEIFGIVETKTKGKRFAEALVILGNEWVFERNKDVGSNERDSI